MIVVVPQLLDYLLFGTCERRGEEANQPTGEVVQNQHSSLGGGEGGGGSALGMTKLKELQILR